MQQDLFNKITAGDSNIMVYLSAEDLKATMMAMYDNAEARKAEALSKQRERPTLTREQAAEALNVTLSTLWRWAKIGYLIPTKIGTKVLYKATDIDNILLQRGGQQWA
jgi:excisionase family DNA binding protein